MTVYVDDMRAPFRRMIMCHMVGETIAELHAMASEIGMRREWFQPFSFPHYDVALARKALAIEKGAVLVTQRELAAITKRLRADEAFMKEWKDAVLARSTLRYPD